MDNVSQLNEVTADSLLECPSLEEDVFRVYVYPDIS